MLLGIVLVALAATVEAREQHRDPDVTIAPAWAAQQEPERPVPWSTVDDAVVDGPVQLPERVLAFVANPPKPIVIAATIAAPALAPVVAPRAGFASDGLYVMSLDEVYAALEASPWPAHLYARVVRIATCESTLKPGNVGDHGRALGLLQVRTDYHPEKVNEYNLLTAAGNLAAAYDIYVEAGHSFSPWSCA